MSELNGNGHLAARVDQAEQDTRTLREFVEDEFRFMREQQKRTNETLDLILKTLALDDREPSGE